MSYAVSPETETSMAEMATKTSTGEHCDHESSVLNSECADHCAILFTVLDIEYNTAFDNPHSIIPTLVTKTPVAQPSSHWRPPSLIS